MKLDHIGIAVRSIEEAASAYRLMGFTVQETVTLNDQGVRVAVLPAGESRIELLEPTNSNSVIQKFLERRGEGIHHVCFRVADLERKLDELKRGGAQILDQVPDRGYENRRVAFVHPKGTHGALIELVEDA